jgi:hypothetical protein
LEFEIKKRGPLFSIYLTLLALVLIYGIFLGITPIIYLFSDFSSLILWIAFPVLSIIFICLLIPLTISAWRKLGKKHGIGVIIGVTLILIISFFTYSLWALFLAGIKTGLQFLF